MIGEFAGSLGKRRERSSVITWIGLEICLVFVIVAITACEDKGSGFTAEEELLQLVPVLVGDRPVSRRDAAEQALRSGYPASKSALKKLLAHENSNANLSALVVLQSVKSPDAEFFPAVYALLDCNKKDVRQMAMQFMYSIGAFPIDFVSAVLEDAASSSADTRGLAIKCLTTDPPQFQAAASIATVVVKNLVNDASENVRIAAAHAIGQLGPNAAHVAGLMTKGLSDQSTAVRYATALALAEMGPAAQVAMKSLVDLTKDEGTRNESRFFALYALARIAPDKYMNQFIRMMADPSLGASVRFLVSSMFPRPETAETALPILEAALDIPGVAFWSLAILERMGPVAAEPLGWSRLEPLTRSKDPMLRGAAIRAICAIAPSREMVPLIGLALADLDGTVRMSAGEGLEKLAVSSSDLARDTVEATTEALNGRLATTRIAAAITLGSLVRLDIQKEDVKRSLRHRLGIETKQTVQRQIELALEQEQ